MYADLLLERGDSPGRRIAFHQGTVEVVRVSAGREYPNCTLGEMVAIACEETRVDYCPLVPLVRQAGGVRGRRRPGGLAIS